MGRLHRRVGGDDGVNIVVQAGEQGSGVTSQRVSQNADRRGGLFRQPEPGEEPSDVPRALGPGVEELQHISQEQGGAADHALSAGTMTREVGE
ncbi:MAG: hypothetical protein M3N10_06050 [Actinomycetota bacterium]|nr:hypothetical protein [Actinomycetota bacterium]